MRVLYLCRQINTYLLYSKIQHSILIIILIIVFQLPSWLQLAHSFQDHSHIHIYDTTGTTKHIHQQFDNNCGFQHQPVNYNFTFEIVLFDFSFSTNQYHISTLVASKLSLQKIVFTHLRAPPFIF